MSGGHYEYREFNLTILADEIEDEFSDGGKYTTEDWSDPHQFYHKRKMVEADHLEGFSDEERKQALTNIKQLIDDLRSCKCRIDILGRFMSGDIGKSGFIERWNETNEITNK